VTLITGSTSDDWIYWHFGYNLSLITINTTRTYKPYSAIADLHTFQFTVVHSLRFSVFTSRLLATDLNTETITSNHHEVFLSSLTLYSSALICIQLIFTIH
jgi:hypothetical protein